MNSFLKFVTAAALGAPCAHSAHARNLRPSHWQFHLCAVAGAAAQTCPTTTPQYDGAVEATSCGGCDAAGLIALEACKADAETVVTCGGAIIGGTGTTTISTACTACVATAAAAAGMDTAACASGTTSSCLNPTMIVRELAPCLPPASAHADRAGLFLRTPFGSHARRESTPTKKRTAARD